MELTREQVESWPGPVVLEFGASWCPHCRAIEPTLMGLLRDHPEVKYQWIEDGRGLELGRSFQVKLWPNFVFLRDGKVIGQMARPRRDELQKAFEKLALTGQAPG